ncbi:MAG: hypothetical protein AABX91_00500 [Nanoarchaeota archaeon]
MPCPHYEGNNKCAFNDSSYVLSVSHVLSYCTTVGSKHQSCKEFVRVTSNRKESHSLEHIGDEVTLPLRSILTRDQLARDIPDAELDSCYTRVGDRFIPK